MIRIVCIGFDDMMPSCSLETVSHREARFWHRSFLMLNSKKDIRDASSRSATVEHCPKEQWTPGIPMEEKALKYSKNACRTNATSFSEYGRGLRAKTLQAGGALNSNLAIQLSQARARQQALFSSSA